MIDVLLALPMWSGSLVAMGFTTATGFVVYLVFYKLIAKYKREDLIEGREKLLREMSHELRSPLARLQASVALAEERKSLDPTERERIDLEIGRMNHVIGEMLRYSSLDAAVATKRKLVRLDKLLAEMIADEKIEAENKGCRLELQTEPNLNVVGDPELLQSCFENIVRNAIYYAPQDSAVEILAQSEKRNRGTEP